MKNNALILLSGGLDSYIALDIARKTNQISLALNFNYGQKAFSAENHAAKLIAKKYDVKLETLKLPFLNKLCENALTDVNNNNFNDFKDVWIPNRNGLFINIAASYCDKFNINKIIIGVNIEEAQKFCDNSKEFIDSANVFLKFSTQVQPEILAPCSGMTKVDMINYAIDNNLDLKIIKSCYDKDGDRKHCGKCMSCLLLYNAIINSKNPDLVKELF